MEYSRSRKFVVIGIVGASLAVVVCTFELPPSRRLVPTSISEESNVRIEERSPLCFDQTRLPTKVSEALNSSKLRYSQRVRELRESFRENGAETAKRTLEAVEANYHLPQMPQGEWHGLVDEIFIGCRSNYPDKEELASKLLALANDKEGDGIVRDYAIQHLGHLTHDLRDSSQIAEKLMLLLTEKEGSIAGTVLLALDNASQNVNLNSDLVSETLMVLMDDQYGESSRITALGLIQRLSPKEAEAARAELSRTVANTGMLSEIIKRQGSF